MTAEQDAWDALDSALQDYPPPCDGLDAFTADRLTEGERALCTSICANCRVADLCEGYAVAAKVPSGFWAGHLYTPKGRLPADPTPSTTDAEADSPAPITSKEIS